MIFSPIWNTAAPECLCSPAVSVASQLECPQAIVTINPDIFTRWVVPNYRLNEVFEVILAAWEIRTLNKSDMCEEAIVRLGGTEDVGKVLLVDNLESNVLDWRGRGGSAYHFRGDDIFGHDAKTLFGRRTGVENPPAASGANVCAETASPNIGCRL